ncbi:MAG TPA: PEP-utilizing enzyme, partial [Actinopolymorphaceae bacterium]
MRENSHFWLFMAASAANRRYVLEIGRRLRERGVLDEPTDVLYLAWDELHAPVTENTRKLVQRRRAAREAAEPGYTMFAPEHLGTRDADATVLRGVPASRGTAVGRVRIVRSEQDFGRLQPGEVLVCPYTNPAWTPLFSLASAVVADVGGLSSHAAIVAREYGIPAVMATTHGTTVLRDGQEVRVDGDAGIVTPIGS